MTPEVSEASMWKKCERCGANHLALRHGLCAACYEQDRQRKPLFTAADRGTTDAGPAITGASALAEEAGKTPR